MDNVVPIRTGVQVRPAGQAASAGPSAWQVLGVVALALVAYEGLRYAYRPRSSRRRSSRRRY